MSALKSSLLLVVLLQSAWANAQVVNKCVDVEGRVTFSDEACPEIGGTTASRHQIQGMSSPIKSDAWRRTSTRSLPARSGATNQPRNTSNSVDTSGYAKKLQFQKEQLTREVRKRPTVEHLRGRAVRVINCQPRNRKGLMAAQEVVADWQRGNPKNLGRTLAKHSQTCTQ